MAYIGRPLQVANLAVQSGTGDGSDTTPIATLDYATVTNGIAVYLDGVRQLAGTDYNVTSQTTLTFTTAPANGVGIDVYFLGLELSLPTPADATVSTAKIADDAVTLAKMAPGTDGNIISYDASGNPVAIATGNDGQVLTSTGAGSPPAFETLSAGKVLQCLSQVYTTAGSTTNTFANDNTKPQISEGDEIMTQAITPANSSNILIIQGVVNIGTGTTGNSIQFALFQDSTANCLAAWNTMPRENNMSIAVPYFYRMVAGTTSSTTFKIRYAGQGATTYINRLSGGNTYDGSYNSSMCVTEIAV